MTISRRGTLAGLAAAPFVQRAAQAQGAAFPSRPLTLIVPFPAGGPADIFGRYLAQGMTANLKQQVVVENKSGAAGVTGMDVVAKASDAHTMGIYSASAGAIMQSLMDKMPYRPGIDLAPVILAVRIQEVLVVNAKFGVSTFAELITKLKANPGKFSYGSAGTGGITHLATELFKIETGTDVLHVPYRGAAPATNDLISDTVQMALLDIPVLLPHIRSGAVKALAISSDTRAPLLPDVPTLRELGFPKVNSDNWYGLGAPGSSLLRDRERLHEAAATALKSKELIDAYAAVGGIVGGGSTEEFARFQRLEVQKWAAVIKAANVKLE
ncbi:MAG: tripartite tricarboxylate transporter substrate-binding protein [Enhydrobacter sp.]